MRTDTVLIGVIGLLLIAVIGGGAFVLLNNDDNNSDTDNSSDSTTDTSLAGDDSDFNDTPETPIDTGNDPDTSTTPEAVTFNVSMTDHDFNPKSLTVKAGQKVTINLSNTEGIHDFVIDELDVDSGELGRGDDTSFSFTVPANASGKSYEYYCSVSNHRALGMVGTLKVE